MLKRKDKSIKFLYDFLQLITTSSELKVSGVVCIKGLIWQIKILLRKIKNQVLPEGVFQFRHQDAQQ